MKYGLIDKWLSRPGLKDFAVSTLVWLLNCYPGGNRLSRLRDIELPCEKNPCSVELRAPANSRHQLATHLREPSWKRTFPSSLHKPGALANTFTTSWEVPRWNQPNCSHIPPPTPELLYEVTNIYYCFQPLNFEKMCYTAISNSRLCNYSER